MPCDDVVRDWMIEAMDGEERPELAAHLANCPDCREELRRVAAIDRLLRAAPDVAPPPGLAVRIDRQLTRSLDGGTAWSRTLAHLGLVVAATATALAALVALGLRPGQGTSGALERVLAAPALAEALEVAVAAARGPLGVVALAGLAAGLAVAWFAVLFVPRLSPGVDRT